MRYIEPILLFTLFGLLALGLQAEEKNEAEETRCTCGNVKLTDPDNPVYVLRGEIQTVMTERNALVVRHQEIPGFMKAMTMMFQVDRRVLDLVKPGQTISARMERRDDGRWWLFGIRILQRTH